MKTNTPLDTLEDTKHEAFIPIKNHASQNVGASKNGSSPSKFLKYLHSKYIIDIFSWDKDKKVCTSCQMEKSCKLPFSLSKTFFRNFY